MKNITLNIIGQSVLADVLKEKISIIKMNISFFENLDEFFKNHINSNIIITDISNFQSIEKSNVKIDSSIFYLSGKRNNINIKTEFQKYELIHYPFNLKNFIEKINLAYLRSKFVVNSKIKILNYTINLNTREITSGENKLKLTEREKDFLLFLKNSKNPKTIRDILDSVWKYSKGIETHTVETHVHRLRKKFLDSFNDSNIIKNNKKGYHI